MTSCSYISLLLTSIIILKEECFAKQKEETEKQMKENTMKQQKHFREISVLKV